MSTDEDEQLRGGEQATQPAEVIKSLRQKYGNLDASVAENPEQAAKIKDEVNTLLRGASKLIREASPSLDDLSTPNTFIFNSAKELNTGLSKDRLAQQLQGAIVNQGEYTTTYNAGTLFQTAQEVLQENEVTTDSLPQWGNLAYGALDVYELAESGAGTAQPGISSDRVSELLPKD